MVSTVAERPRVSRREDVAESRPNLLADMVTEAVKGSEEKAERAVPQRLPSARSMPRPFAYD